MGMFDEIKCSSNIGELTNVVCQTKDIDYYYGGNLSFYWVDPSGALFFIDYTGTHDYFENIDPNVSVFDKVRFVPNGNHGRCGPTTLTRDIVVYNSKTHPDGLVDLVKCKLSFVSGKLLDFSYINNFIEN